MLASLPAEKRAEFVASLTDQEAAVLVYDWTQWARPSQIMPTGDWDGWLILAGRGFGKTRTGAEAVIDEAQSGRSKRIGLVGETSADGKDVMVNGESGIMACSPPWFKPKFVAGSSNGRPKLTWPNGAIATLYDAREPEQLRGPQHDFCFVAGTLIEAAQGHIPIERIQPGDQVRTRKGWRTVRGIGHRQDSVGKVSFSTGAVLCGTADHPIYTPAGWRGMAELTAGEVVCARDVSNGAANAGTATPGHISNIAAPRHWAGQTVTACIVRFGRTLTVLLRRATMSTTKTATFSTMRWTTSNAYPAGPTWRFTPLLRQFLGQIGRQCLRFLPLAPTAAATCIDAPFVPLTDASPARARMPSGRARPSGNASAAAQVSSHAPATIAASVVSTWADAGRQTVYNLQVDGEPEYFANGVLVHNCWFDELAKYRYAQACFDQAMFGLRLGKHPRWLATTTPKNIPLIKDLIAREGKGGVIVTRGKSDDNLGNLAPSYVRNVIEKYRNTRLGRQELNAEILEDTPGALWSRRALDENRVEKAPKLVRVIVAVDPPATSGETANECGIVVVGVDETGRAFVLDDWSTQATPDEWARKVVAAYRLHNADLIVAEINQGGEMVEAVIRSVMPSAPYKSVRATRGKYIRAEPISALYEQGRVKHVGTFTALEDQMVGFTPERAADRSNGYSPDRVDALVWGLTELFSDVVDADDDPTPRRHSVPAGGFFGN